MVDAVQPQASSAPQFDLNTMSNDDLLAKPEPFDLSKVSNDQILGSHPQTSVPYFLGPGELSGYVTRDHFFQDTPQGRILGAFGHAAGQAWDTSDFDPDTEKSLRQSGLITSNEDSPWARPIKAFSESILRTGAMAFHAAMSAPGALIAGASAAAGQEVRNVGEEMAAANPAKAGLIRSITNTQAEEAEKTGNLAAFAIPDAMAVPRPIETPLPKILQDARDLGVIGPGSEAEWKPPVPAAEKPAEVKAPEPVASAPVAATEAHAPLTNGPAVEKLADLHEKEAERVLTAEAAQAGHGVEGEMTSAAVAHPPIGEDVIEPGGAGRSGRGLGEGAENTEALGREGEEAGDHGRGSEESLAPLPEISLGFGDDQAEGFGVREGEGTADSERNAGEAEALALPKQTGPVTEVPFSAHDDFAPAPLPEQYFDRAGNINLATLNRPEDIKAVLRAAASANNDFQELRGGIQSLAEQQKVADALGLNAQDFTPNRPPGISESTWLRAVKDLTLRSATDVRDLMAKVKDTGSDADAAALAKALSRHNTIQGEFSRAKAESGRALAANRWDDQRALVEGAGRMAEQATGMTLDKIKVMAAEAAPLETPAQISEFVDRAMKPGMAEKAMYIATNGLISGLRTHSVYEAATVLGMIERAGLEKPLAAAYSNLAEMMGQDLGAGDKVYWREAGASAYGIVKGIPDGVSAAIKAWKSNVTQLLPGEKELPGIGFHRQPIEGLAGDVIGAPGRLVTTMHSFNRSVLYSQRLHELAVRDAIDRGLTGDDMAAHVNSVVSSPNDAMMSDAVTYANRYAYMKKPEFGSVAQKIESLANSNIYTKFAVPFARVTNNIIGEAVIDHSLVGLLNKDVRDTLSGGKGAAAAAEQRAALTAGVLIGGAMVGLYLQDKATGYGPTDPNERRLWLVDHQPFSVRAGNTWVSYSRIGHLGMLMKMGSGFGESLSAMNEHGVDAGIFELGHSIMHSIVDETPLVTLSNMASILEEAPKKVIDPDTGEESYEPNRKAERAIASMMEEPIPFSSFLRQSAEAFDPYKRQTHGLKEDFQNMIPGWRNQLMPMRDPWGQPVPSSQSPITALVSAPFQQSGNAKPDPVSDELMRLGIHPSSAPQRIKGVPLTPQQYDDYARVSGTYMRARFEESLAHDGWSEMPPAEKANAVRQIVSGSHAQAQDAILMQYPSIMENAINMRLRAMGQPPVDYGFAN